MLSHGSGEPLAQEREGKECESLPFALCHTSQSAHTWHCNDLMQTTTLRTKKG